MLFAATPRCILGFAMTFCNSYFEIGRVSCNSVCCIFRTPRKLDDDQQQEQANARPGADMIRAQLSVGAAAANAVEFWPLTRGKQHGFGACVWQSDALRAYCALCENSDQRCFSKAFAAKIGSRKGRTVCALSRRAEGNLLQVSMQKGVPCSVVTSKR